MSSVQFWELLSLSFQRYFQIGTCLRRPWKLKFSFQRRSPWSLRQYLMVVVAFLWKLSLSSRDEMWYTNRTKDTKECRNLDVTHLRKNDFLLTMIAFMNYVLAEDCINSKNIQYFKAVSLSYFRFSLLDTANLSDRFTKLSIYLIQLVY